MSNIFQFVHWKLTIVTLLTVMLGSLFLFNPTSSHAATLPQQASGANFVTLSVAPHVNTAQPEWVKKGEKFVYVNNYVATVDPSITRFLDTATVRTIKSAVAQYNNLDYLVRVNGIVISPAQGYIHPNISPWCPDQVRSNPVWWGWSYWLNKCAVTDLTAGGATAGIVAAMLSGPGGLIIAVYVINLQWASGQCRNGSVFFNLGFSGGPWFGPGC